MQAYNFSSYFNEGPSKPKRVGSGDIAAIKALIGSQVFCQKGEGDSGRKPRHRNTSWFVWKAVDKLKNPDFFVFGGNLTSIENQQRREQKSY